MKTRPDRTLFRVCQHRLVSAQIGEICENRKTTFRHSGRCGQSIRARARSSLPYRDAIAPRADRWCPGAEGVPPSSRPRDSAGSGLRQAKGGSAATSRSLWRPSLRMDADDFLSYAIPAARGKCPYAPHQLDCESAKKRSAPPAASVQVGRSLPRRESRYTRSPTELPLPCCAHSRMPRRATTWPRPVCRTLAAI
jgi:hypothetical protein